LNLTLQHALGYHSLLPQDIIDSKVCQHIFEKQYNYQFEGAGSDEINYAAYASYQSQTREYKPGEFRLLNTSQDNVGFYYLEGSGELLCGEHALTVDSDKQCGVFISRHIDPFKQRWVMYNNKNRVHTDSGGTCTEKCTNEKIGKLLYMIDNDEYNDADFPPHNGWIVTDSEGDQYIEKMSAYTIEVGMLPAPTVSDPSKSCNTLYKNYTVDRVMRTRYDSERLPFKPLHIHAQNCHVYFRQGTKCLDRLSCALTYSVIGEKGTKHQQFDTTGYYAIKVDAPHGPVGKNNQLLPNQPCILEIIVPYKDGHDCSTKTNIKECYKDKIEILMPDTLITGSTFTRRVSAGTHLVDDGPMYEIKAFVPLDFGAQKLVVRGDWKRAAFKSVRVGVLDINMEYGHLQIMQLELMHTTVRFHEQVQDVGVKQFNDGQPCHFPFTAYWPDGTRSVHTQCAGVTAVSPVGKAFKNGAFNGSDTPPQWCSTAPYYMRFDAEKQIFNSDVGDWGDWHANENYCDSCYQMADVAGLQNGVVDSFGVKKALAQDIAAAYSFTRFNIRTRPVVHLRQEYTHKPNGCVKGHNIELFENMTVFECEYRCNRNTECVAFEYGVNHNGTQDLYHPNDCQLQTFYFDDMSKETDCQGTDFNLDLYVKVTTLLRTYELRECTGSASNDCSTAGESLITNKQDCAVGAWSAWSACSKTCGHATKFRTREVTQRRQKAGRQCPHLDEHEQCYMSDCMKYENGKELTMYWKHWGFCGYGALQANGSFMDTVPSIYLGNGDAWINVVNHIDVLTQTYEGANCFKAPILKVDIMCQNATNQTMMDEGGTAFVQNLTNASAPEKKCSTRATLRLPFPGESADIDDITCHKGCRGCSCEGDPEFQNKNPGTERPIMNITTPNGAVYLELINCTNGFNDDQCTSYDSSTTPYYDSKRDPNPTGTMNSGEENKENGTTATAVMSYEETMEMTAIESLALLKFTDDSAGKLSGIQRDVEAQQGRDVIVISEVDAPGMNFGKFMFATMKPYVYMPFTPLIMAFSASLMAPVVMRKQTRIVPGMCPVIDMRYWGDIDDDSIQRIGYIADLFNRTINVRATQRLTLLTQSSGPAAPPTPADSGVSWMDPAILWDPIFGKERWISLHFSKSIKWGAQKLLLWDNFYYLFIIVLSLFLAFSVGLVGGFISLLVLLYQATKAQLHLLDEQADKVRVLHSEEAKRDPSKSPLEVMELQPGVRVKVEGEKVMVHQLGLFWNARKEIPITWLQKGGHYANCIGHVNLFQLVNTTLGGLMNMSRNSTQGIFSAMEIHHVRPDVEFEPVTLRDFVEEYETFCNRHNMASRSLQSEAQLSILKSHQCMVEVMESDEIAGYEYIKMRELDLSEQGGNEHGEEEGDGDGAFIKKKGPKESAPTRFLTEMYQKTTFAANFVQLIELQEEYDRYCVINSIPEDERKDLKTSDNEFQAFGAVYNASHKLYEITGIARKAELDDLADTQSDSAPHPGFFNMLVTALCAGAVVTVLHLFLGLDLWPLICIVPGAVVISLVVFDVLRPQYLWLFVGAVVPLVGTMERLHDKDDIVPGGPHNTGFYLWYLLHCAWVLPPLVNEFANQKSWLGNLGSYHDASFDAMMKNMESHVPAVTNFLVATIHSWSGFTSVLNQTIILAGSNLGFYVLCVGLTICTMASAGTQDSMLLLYYSIPAVLAIIAGWLHVCIHKMKHRPAEQGNDIDVVTQTSVGEGVPTAKVPFKRARRFLNLIRIWVPTPQLLTLAVIASASQSKASKQAVLEVCLTTLVSTVVVWFRGRHTCAFPFPDCSFVKIQIIQDATADDTLSEVIKRNAVELSLKWTNQFLMLLTAIGNTFYLRELVLVVVDLVLVLLVPAGPLAVVMYAETSKHIYSPYQDTSLNEFYFIHHAPSTKWSNDYLVLPSWVDQLEFYSLVIWGITLSYYAWGLIEYVMYCLAWDLSQPFVPHVWTTPKIILHTLFTYLSILFGALALAYVVLVCIWLVLAAVLNPNRFLPICAMTLTVVGFALAKIKLLKSGQTNIKDMVKAQVMKNFGDRAKDSVIGQKVTKVVGEDAMDDLVQGDLKGAAAQQLEKRLKMPAEVIEGMMAGDLAPLKAYVCEKYQVDSVVIDGIIAVALADMPQLSTVANVLGERFHLPNRMASNFVGLHATLALPSDQQQGNIALITKDLVLGAFPSINPHVLEMLMGLPMNQPSEFLGKANELVRSTAMRAMEGGSDTSGFERFIAQVVGCGIAIPKACLGVGKWLQAPDLEVRASILEGLEACFRDLFIELELPHALATIFTTFMSDAADSETGENAAVDKGGEGSAGTATSAAAMSEETNAKMDSNAAASADKAVELVRQQRMKLRLMMEELVKQALPSLDASLITAASEIGDGNPAPMLQVLGLDRSVYDLGMKLIGILSKVSGGVAAAPEAVLSTALPLMEAVVEESKAPVEVLHIARLFVKLAAVALGEKIDKRGIVMHLVPLLSKHIFAGTQIQEKIKLAEKLLNGALLSVTGECDPETSARNVVMALVATVIDAQMLSVGVQMKGHKPIGVVTVSGLAIRLLRALKGVSTAEAVDIDGENSAEPTSAGQMREVIAVLKDLATVLYLNQPKDSSEGKVSAERVVDALHACLTFITKLFERASVSDASKLAPIMACAISGMIPVVMYALSHDFLSTVTCSQQHRINLLMGDLQNLDRLQTNSDFPRLKRALRMLRVMIVVALKVGLKRYGEVVHLLLPLLEEVGIRFDMLNMIKRNSGLSGMAKNRRGAERLGVALIGLSAPDIAKFEANQQLGNALAAAVYRHLVRNNALSDHKGLVAKESKQLSFPNVQGPALTDVPKERDVGCDATSSYEFRKKCVEKVQIDILLVEESLFEMTDVTFTWGVKGWGEDTEYSLVDALQDPAKMELFEDDICKFLRLFEQHSQKSSSASTQTMHKAASFSPSIAVGAHGSRQEYVPKSVTLAAAKQPIRGGKLGSGNPRSGSAKRHNASARPKSGRHLSASAKLFKHTSPWDPKGMPRGLKFLFAHTGSGISEDAIILIDCCYGRVQVIKQLIMSICAWRLPQLSPDLLHPLLELLMLLFTEDKLVDQSARWRQVVAIMMEPPLTVTITRAIEHHLPDQDIRDRMLPFVPLLTSALLQHATRRDIHHVATTKSSTTSYSKQALSFMHGLGQYIADMLLELIQSVGGRKQQQPGGDGDSSDNSRDDGNLERCKALLLTVIKLCVDARDCGPVATGPTLSKQERLQVALQGLYRLCIDNSTVHDLDDICLDCIEMVLQAEVAKQKMSEPARKEMTSLVENFWEEDEIAPERRMADSEKKQLMHLVSMLLVQGFAFSANGCDLESLLALLLCLEDGFRFCFAPMLGTIDFNIIQIFSLSHVGVDNTAHESRYDELTKFAKVVDAESKAARERPASASEEKSVENAHGAMDVPLDTKPFLPIPDWLLGTLDAALSLHERYIGRGTSVPKCENGASYEPAKAFIKSTHICVNCGKHRDNHKTDPTRLSQKTRRIQNSIDQLRDDLKNVHDEIHDFNLTVNASFVVRGATELSWATSELTAKLPNQRDVLAKLRELVKRLQAIAKTLNSQVSNVLPKLCRQILQFSGIRDEDLLKKAISAVLPFVHAFFSHSYDIDLCLKPGGRAGLREAVKVAAQQIMQQILARFMRTFMVQLETKAGVECMELLQESIPLPKDEFETMMVFVKPLVTSLLSMVMTGSKSGVTTMRGVFNEGVTNDLTSLLWTQRDVVERLLVQAPMHFPKPLTEFLLAFLCKKRTNESSVSPALQQASEMVSTAKPAMQNSSLPVEAKDALRDLALALIEKMHMHSLFEEAKKGADGKTKLNKKKIELLSELLENLVGSALQKNMSEFVKALAATLQTLASGEAKTLQLKGAEWLRAVSGIINGDSPRKILDLLADTLKISPKERKTLHEGVFVAYHTISIIKQLRNLAAGADMEKLREMLVQTMLMLLNPSVLKSERELAEAHLADCEQSAKEAGQQFTLEVEKEARKKAAKFAKERIVSLTLGVDITDSFIALAIQQRSMAVRPLASAMDQWLKLPKCMTMPLLEIAMSRSGHQATLGTEIAERTRGSGDGAIKGPKADPLVTLLAPNALKQWLLDIFKLVVDARNHDDIIGDADRESEERRDEWFLSAIEVLCSPLEFPASKFRANVKIASGADVEVAGQCIAHLNVLKRIAAMSTTTAALNNPSWRKACKEFLMVMHKRFQLHDEDLGLLRCLISGDILDDPDWSYDVKWIADLKRVPEDVTAEEWDGRTAKVNSKDMRSQSVEKWLVGQFFKIINKTTPKPQWSEDAAWSMYRALGKVPAKNTEDAIRRCARLIVAPFFVPTNPGSRNHANGMDVRAQVTASIKSTAAKLGKSALMIEAATLLSSLVPVAIGAKVAQEAKSGDSAVPTTEFKNFMEADIFATSSFNLYTGNLSWVLDLLRGLLGKLFSTGGGGSSGKAGQGLLGVNVFDKSKVFSAVLGAAGKLNASSSPSMLSCQFGKIIPHLMKSLPVGDIVHFLVMTGFKVIDGGTKDEAALKLTADKARLLFSAFYSIWVSMTVADHTADSGPRQYEDGSNRFSVGLPSIHFKIGLANALQEVYNSMIKLYAEAHLGVTVGSFDPKDALEKVVAQIKEFIKSLKLPTTSVGGASQEPQQTQDTQDTQEIGPIFSLHRAICNAMASYLESSTGIETSGLRSGVAAAAMLGAAWDVVCSQVAGTKPPSLLKLFKPMIDLWQAFFSSMRGTLKAGSGESKQTQQQQPKTDYSSAVNQISKWALARDWASLMPEQVWDTREVPAQCFGWECIDCYEERWFKVSFPGARALVVNLELLQPKKDDAVIAEVTLHDWENDVSKRNRGKQLLPSFIATALCGPVTDPDVDGDGRSFKRVTQRLLQIDTDEMWVCFRSRVRAIADSGEADDEPQNLCGFRVWIWPMQATAAQKEEQQNDIAGHVAIENWWMEHLYKEDLMGGGRSTQSFTLELHGEQHAAGDVVSVDTEDVDDSLGIQQDDAQEEWGAYPQPAHSDPPTLNPYNELTRAGAPDEPVTSSNAADVPSTELHYEWQTAGVEKGEFESAGDNNGLYVNFPEALVLALWFEIDNDDPRAMAYFHENYELHIFKDMSETDRWAELPYQNARFGRSKETAAGIQRDGSTFIWPIRGQNGAPRQGPSAETISGPKISSIKPPQQPYFQRLIIPRNSFWATVVKKELYDPWNHVGGEANVPAASALSSEIQGPSPAGKKRALSAKQQLESASTLSPPQIRIRMMVKDVKLFSAGFPLYWMPTNIAVPSVTFAKWKDTLDREILLRRCDPVFAGKLQQQLHQYAIDFLALVQLDDDESIWELQSFDAKDKGLHLPSSAGVNRDLMFPKSKVDEFQGHILAIATSMLTRDLQKTQQCIFWAMEMAADMPMLSQSDSHDITSESNPNTIEYHDGEINMTAMKFASVAVASALLNGRVAPGTAFQDVGGMLSELVREFFPPDSGSMQAGLVGSVLAETCDAVGRGLVQGTPFAMLSELAYHGISCLCNPSTMLVENALKVAGLVEDRSGKASVETLNAEKVATSQHQNVKSMGAAGGSKKAAKEQLIPDDDHEDEEVVQAKKDAVLQLLDGLVQVAGAATRQAMHDELSPPPMRQGQFSVEDDDVGDGQVTLSADSMFATMAFPGRNVGKRGKWYFEVKLLIMEDKEMDDHDGNVCVWESAHVSLFSVNASRLPHCSFRFHLLVPRTI
jgi:hypothetical protein